MPELTREQLQRQDEVDTAIHGLFQELLGNPIADPIPWDIEKVARVREAVQDAFGMTEEERLAFYPWISDPAGLPGQSEVRPVDPDDGRHECANCGEDYPASALNTIQDYFERVEPGGLVPSGECPNCGALCYPLSENPDDVEPG